MDSGDNQGNQLINELAEILDAESPKVKGEDTSRVSLLPAIGRTTEPVPKMVKAAKVAPLSQLESVTKKAPPLAIKKIETNLMHSSAQSSEILEAHRLNSLQGCKIRTAKDLM